MKTIYVDNDGVLVLFNFLPELYDIGFDLKHLIRDKKEFTYASAQVFEKFIHKLYLAMENIDYEG